MLKKIFKIIRRVVFTVFLLYGYNLIMSPLNLMIPINLITVGFISILGSGALLGFIAILLIVF